MTADSTPAPWGPPEGLGLNREPHGVMPREIVVFTDAEEWTGAEWDRRYYLTPGLVQHIYVHDVVHLVPPTPGGES